jgi:hypothetical protein
MSADIPKVAVLIPCYCASGEVGEVVKDVLEAAEQLADRCELAVLVVNDACPQGSWREIAPHPQVQGCITPRTAASVPPHSRAWKPLWSTTAKRW